MSNFCVVKCVCGQLRTARLDQDSARCFSCGKTFTINPKNRLSKIVFDSPRLSDCIYYIEQHSIPVDSSIKRASDTMVSTRSKGMLREGL